MLKYRWPRTGSLSRQVADPPHPSRNGSSRSCPTSGHGGEDPSRAPGIITECCFSAPRLLALSAVLDLNTAPVSWCWTSLDSGRMNWRQMLNLLPVGKCYRKKQTICTLRGSLSPEAELSESLCLRTEPGSMMTCLFLLSIKEDLSFQFLWKHSSSAFPHYTWRKFTQGCTHPTSFLLPHHLRISTHCNPSLLYSHLTRAVFGLTNRMPLSLIMPLVFYSSFMDTIIFSASDFEVQPALFFFKYFY